MASEFLFDSPRIPLPSASWTEFPPEKFHGYFFFFGIFPVRFLSEKSRTAVLGEVDDCGIPEEFCSIIC